ncbi:MAG: choice-of-anchor L domain-containing protein [Bacteroidota bacterium]
MRKLSLSIIGLFIFTFSYSQIETDTTLTMEEMVFDYLLGEGVTASNVSFTGLKGQFGFFNGQNTNLGVDSGIVLSSGMIEYNAPAFGLLGNAIDQYAGQNINGPGDPDLLTIAQSVETNPAAGQINNTQDVAILEFDFVPAGDTIRFNFVFGSDEYNTYINSQFNDVFAFLISGPGISGPYAAPAGFPNGAANFANVPGTDPPLPITISTIYEDPTQTPPALNEEYYINNDGGAGHTLNAFTTKIEIIAAVECTETYHFKFAIADCQDGFLATSVFLEAGSFSSVPDALTLNSFFPGGLVELSDNCDSSFANFKRLCAADTGFYQIKLQGDIDPATDLVVSNLPDTIILLPGVYQHDFGINAINDGIEEGEEVIEAILCSADSENGPFLPQDTAYISIFDENVLPIASPDINLICPADEVILIAEASQGLPAYDYTWLNSAGDEVGSGPILTVPVPTESAQYTVGVIDLCGFTGDNQVVITNSIPPDPTVSIGDNGEPFCPGAPYPLQANIQDGTPGFTYSWLPTGDLTDTTTITPPPSSLGGFPVTLFITDFCNRVAEATIEYLPPLPPQPVLEFSEILCLGDPLALETTIAEGTGTPPYNFLYLDVTNGGIIDPDFYSATSSLGEVPDLPLGTQEIQVVVTDYCQEFDPIYAGFDGDTLETITCFIPNVITPNGDSQNDVFQVFEMLSRAGTLHIFNRWGAEVLESRENTWDGADYPGGTYFYVVEFDDGTESKSGSFTMLRSN